VIYHDDAAGVLDDVLMSSNLVAQPHDSHADT
jgi:hypothetical protein